MQAIATFQVGYCVFADKGNRRSTTRESVLRLPSADHGRHHSVRTTHRPLPEAAAAAAPGTGPELSVHLPRSERGVPAVRPGPGDETGPHRGAGHRGRHF